MSSAEVFAHAARVHEQAVALRQKADVLQQAVDQVRLSPGTATSTLSAPSCGPKALATEQLMQVSFDVLRFAVTQATSDVEELRVQAPQTPH